MKKLIILPVALGILVACSSNTPYVDKEFGKGTRMAFDAQIVDHSYQQAGKVPEGTTSIPAERIMNVYTDDFGKVTKTQDIGKPFEPVSSK